MAQKRPAIVVVVGKLGGAASVVEVAEGPQDL